MHKRLYEFIEMHSLSHLLQFGFREKHFTLHTLISLTESTEDSIDYGSYGCGIFIDLQKAFDTVNHQILLKNWSITEYGVLGFAGFHHIFLQGNSMYLLMAAYLINSIFNLVFHKDLCLDPCFPSFILMICQMFPNF